MRVLQSETGPANGETKQTRNDIEPAASTANPTQKYPTAGSEVTLKRCPLQQLKARCYAAVGAWQGTCQVHNGRDKAGSRCVLQKLETALFVSG